MLVPAAVLRGHKAVNLGGEHGEGFVGAQAVVAGLAVAVLNALHEAGLADFNVFVEVGAGDGQELDALQQRIGRVFGFFKHTPVELHPGVVPAVEKLLFLCGSGHRSVSAPCWQSTAFSRQTECKVSRCNKMPCRQGIQRSTVVKTDA